MRLYRIVAALIGWTVIGLQYWLMVSGKPAGEIANLTVNFFSFFTILTNILVALALTLPVVAPGSGAGRFFSAAGTRAAVATWITVVGAIYLFVLSRLWAPTGLQWWVDSGLHYAMPVIYVLDWLLFAPKAELRWSGPLKWTAYPLLYSAWTLVHGAMSGWYPYPFADAAALGYPQVLTNLAAMTGLFVALGLVFVAIGKLLAGRRVLVA